MIVLMLERPIKISIINMLIIVSIFSQLNRTLLCEFIGFGTIKVWSILSFWAIYLLFEFVFLYRHDRRRRPRSGNDHILFAIKHFLLDCISCLGSFLLFLF